ncbi:hypothetical protein V8E51_018479 [Hyaloscypha variabilis]
MDRSWFRKKGCTSVKRQGEREAKEVDEKAILASAISKYVVKLGRLTSHFELSLNASGLLPPKPGGWATMMGDSNEPSSETIGGQSMPETLEVENEKFEVKGDGWDWRRIEAENKKGLKVYGAARQQRATSPCDMRSSSWLTSRPMRPDSEGGSPSQMLMSIEDRVGVWEIEGIKVSGSKPRVDRVLGWGEADRVEAATVDRGK